MNSEQLVQKKESSGFWYFLIYGLIGLMIAFGFRLVIEPSVVIGESMDTTLKDGQYLLNYRLAYKFNDPEYGDIVIVKPTGENELKEEFIIKRVIGLPGDTVEFKNNELYLNGKLMQERYIPEPMTSSPDAVFEVGEDEIFIMGDNRNHSIDSRVIGPVNYKDEVRGKVVLSVSPFDQSFKESGEAIAVN